MRELIEIFWDFKIYECSVKNMKKIKYYDLLVSVDG
jgi:hypothetical protein